MKINTKALELLTAKGFDKLYFDKLKDTNIKTNEAAYNAAEEVFKKYFKKNRYKNFDSYRVSKNKRLKAKV